MCIWNIKSELPGSKVCSPFLELAFARLKYSAPEESFTLRKVPPPGADDPEKFK
jgi:hypothetical protein